MPQAIQRSWRRPVTDVISPERADQHGERRGRADEQVDRLGAIEHIERAREQRPDSVPCDAAATAITRAAPSSERRQIHQRDEQR